jgi:MYXO-CTERM domain-containing protein
VLTLSNLTRLRHALGCGRWIALIPALAACSAPAETSAEHVGAAQEAIYAGTIDNDGTAADGVVSIKVGNGSQFELCSGTLLSKNVVLTARHCVSKTITTTVSCNEHGDSGNGDHVGDDESLDILHVYTGAKPLYGASADAGIRAIVHPDGGVLCNSDIALLILDREITEVAPMRVRLGSTPHPGETVRAVGYGQNDMKLPVGTRFRKDAVKVLATGRRVSASQTPLGTHEFEVGLSICQGDSGGPAISEDTGAVIGVVSRGGDCGDDFGHIYTATNGFTPLFAKAFALAGGAPIDEGVDPLADVPAPDPQPPPAAAAPQTHGCSTGPAPTEGGWLLALAAFLLVRRRR